MWPNIKFRPFSSLVYHQLQVDTVTCVFKFLLQSHSIVRAAILAYQSISVIWSITNKILYYLEHSSQFRTLTETSQVKYILVPRGRAPFGQHQESWPLAWSNNGSPRFTDFPSLCACSESSLKNLIGSGLNLLCFQSHSKRNVVGPGQRSRFLVLTKRSAASGDENESSIDQKEASEMTKVDN